MQKKAAASGTSRLRDEVFFRKSELPTKIRNSLNLKFQKMKIANLDRTTLMLFLTLMETKNLNDAAHQLGMPAPTASRLLAKMRETFGDPLFTRWAHGMRPTQRAIQMLPTVRDILASMDQLMSRKRFDPKTLQRTLRIGCMDNAVSMVVEPVLGRIFQMAPDVLIEVCELTDGFLGDLSAGKLDLAIFPIREVPDNYEMQALYECEQMLAVGPTHPLVSRYASNGTLTVEDIERYSRIEIMCGPSQHWRMTHQEKGLPGQKVAFRTPYFLAGAMALQTTELTMELPSVTAHRLEALGLIRAFPMPKSKPSNIPKLIWHESSVSDPAVQWLRSVLVTGVADDTPI